ncbi:MAG: flagellar motor switch protein FliN [Candidatus Latescibacterota bacterium]
MTTQDVDGRGAAAVSRPEAADGAAPAEVLAELDDLEVEVSVELGRQRLTLDEALALGEQSVLPLDRVAGEPVEVRLNGRVFARGEVVTVGERFGVRLTEIVTSRPEA